jgi:methionyl-tRNA synthetase
MSIPFSDRSDNHFTRTSQERDRALLPEPVQELLRGLFEKRDQLAKDEVEIEAAIERELTKRDAELKAPTPHRWSTGSRTCDNCGRDYDWSHEACSTPLPLNDARRQRVVSQP